MNMGLGCKAIVGEAAARWRAMLAAECQRSHWMQRPARYRRRSHGKLSLSTVKLVGAKISLQWERRRCANVRKCRCSLERLCTQNKDYA